MARSKEGPLPWKLSSFRRGRVGTLVCLVPDRRGDWETFGTLGVARIY
jgi:hypothetical protein